MKKISQKLKWLKGIIHKCVTKNKDKSMYLACMGMMLFVEGLEEKTEKKEYPTEEELTEEVGDVMCMIELLHEYDLVSYTDIEERVKVKRNKLKKWSDLIE